MSTTATTAPATISRLATGRAALALTATALRYRHSVEPTVREELARWQDLAREIAAPQLRALALAKLGEEGANARAGAMLAAHAPARQRSQTTRVIVAAEVLFDYLDGRTESVEGGEPLAARRELYAIFTAAVEMRRAPSTSNGDGRYLQQLAETVNHGLAAMPSVGIVRERIGAAAARAAEAQVRAHAAAELGTEQLEQWSRQSAKGSEMDWREHLAGCAASVLAVHALTVRAAQPAAGGADPEQLDRAYLQLAALATLLDGLVDRDDEATDGPPGYGALFDDPDQLHASVLDLAARAGVLTYALGPRHLMMLGGLIAHYAAAPGAEREPAASVLAALLARQHPTVAIARMLMSDWRRPTASDGVRALGEIRAGDEPAG